MYKVVNSQDKKIILVNGDIVNPTLTLESKFDDRAQIVWYNNEYVLFLANRVGTYNRAKEWFPEAIKALEKLKKGLNTEYDKIRKSKIRRTD